MEIIILSIFILSIVVYYIYAKLRGREERVLIKYQVVQLMVKKEAPISKESLLEELNDMRQPNEIKMKHLEKVIYEMLEQSTMLVNTELEVQLHPRISDLSDSNNKKK